MPGTIVTGSAPAHRLSWYEIPPSATMRSELLQTKPLLSASVSQLSPRTVRLGKPRTAPKYRATETIMLAAIPLTGQQPARLLFSSARALPRDGIPEGRSYYKDRTAAYAGNGRCSPAARGGSGSAVKCAHTANAHLCLWRRQR